MIPRKRPAAGGAAVAAAAAGGGAAGSSASAGASRGASSSSSGSDGEPILGLPGQQDVAPAQQAQKQQQQHQREQQQQPPKAQQQKAEEQRREQQPLAEPKNVWAAEFPPGKPVGAVHAALGVRHSAACCQRARQLTCLSILSIALLGWPSGHSWPSLAGGLHGWPANWLVQGLAFLLTFLGGERCIHAALSAPAPAPGALACALQAAASTLCI